MPRFRPPVLLVCLILDPFWLLYEFKDTMYVTESRTISLNSSTFQHLNDNLQTDADYERALNEIARDVWNVFPRI